MTATGARPWTTQYDPGIDPDLRSPHADALAVFEAAVAARPDAPALAVDDRTTTYAALDAASDAVAVALAGRGAVDGARVALQLQNDPQFVIAVLGAWKAGAVPVPVNPMWRADEVRQVLDDVEPVVLVVRDDLVPQCAPALAGSTVTSVLTTPGTLLPRPAGAAATAGTALGVPSADLDALVAAGPAGPVPARPELAATPAYLVCTSGTTGRPKAAITTHANLLHNAEVYHRWLGTGPDDVVLGSAPLFHITGLVAGIALAHRAACPLVLLHRFAPATCLAAVERWGATTTVMAITAYLALMEHPAITTTDLSSLTRAYSGGAPVDPAVAARWQEATGSPIGNVYGLTETTSPTHMAPRGRPGRVHPDLGMLSVGVPVPGARARIVEEGTRTEAPAGQPGEIEVRGPMVVPGYWRRDLPVARPDDGWFATGDIGIADEDGWFYVVDRSKDMINASGFKVWPREVEDGLRRHPAVRDAAVVGVPDPYRGETVVGFVTLRQGATATGADLVAFCREGMAAYKYPRRVEVLDELPTSAAGKVLRRELRERATALT